MLQVDDVVLFRGFRLHRCSPIGEDYTPFDIILLDKSEIKLVYEKNNMYNKPFVTTLPGINFNEIEGIPSLSKVNLKQIAARFGI